jgi:hypothetical protein
MMERHNAARPHRFCAYFADIRGRQGTSCVSSGRKVIPSRSSKTYEQQDTWIIIAAIVIVVMLLGGLLPLPGQKDNVTPHSEPSPPAQSPR